MTENPKEKREFLELSRVIPERLIIVSDFIFTITCNIIFMLRLVASALLSKSLKK